MAQRIASLFLDDWVGDLAGSVRAKRRDPATTTAPKQRESTTVACPNRPGKVTPEILGFIRDHRTGVENVRREVFVKFGITLGAGTIYKIWNGWCPASFNFKTGSTSRPPVGNDRTRSRVLALGDELLQAQRISKRQAPTFGR